MRLSFLVIDRLFLYELTFLNSQMVTLHHRGFVGVRCQLFEESSRASYCRPKHCGFQTLTSLSRQSI